jgi:hypothetical protein
MERSDSGPSERAGDSRPQLPLALVSLARRGYELGRVRYGARLAWPALALAAASLLGCRHIGQNLLLGVVLFAAAAVLGWRGEGWARGVRPGLFAGAFPLALPILTRTAGHVCLAGSCWSACFIACLAGGAVAGGLIGSSAARRGPLERGPFLAAASVVAGLAGLLGCVYAGVPGGLGMVLGYAATSAPVVLLYRPAPA